jgi:outer membrane lipoprotein-sorting protein
VVQSATLDQLLSRINQQYDAVQTMNASVEISAATGGARNGAVKEYTSLAGYIFLRKPEELRVLLLLPVIRSKALDMVSDGKTFKLLIPPKNRAVVGTSEVTEPSKNGLENLRPAVFFDSLLVKGVGANQVVSLTQDVRLIEPADKAKELVEEPDYDIAVLAQPNGQTVHTERVVHIGRSTLLPYQQDIYDASGQVATRAFYSDYQKYGSIQFPTRIVIRRPLDEYSLTLVVTKITFNEKLEDDQFELKIPENVSVQQVK